jgi:multisubunit Na+/H+ antiporter MnhC subunit
VNARAYSIAAVGQGVANTREAHSTRHRDAGDLQAAVGIMTAIAISVAFWAVILLIAI